MDAQRQNEFKNILKLFKDTADSEIVRNSAASLLIIIESGDDNFFKKRMADTIRELETDIDRFSHKDSNGNVIPDVRHSFLDNLKNMFNTIE